VEGGIVERSISDAEQALVSELVEAGAVNFDALGSALSKHGPQLAREAVASPGSRSFPEPWDVFCGTMRHYVRIYRLGPVVGGLEDLGQLRQVGRELG
jgi:hypothetical protein